MPVGTGGMVVLRKMRRGRGARARRARSTKGICDVANINAPGQIVLSGEIAAMEQAIELAGPRKAMKLPVSVPFHSSLLADAAGEFGALLESTEIADPTSPIYCNVDAAPVSTAADVRSALQRQFAGSVLWMQSVERMLADGFRRFVEFGPKPTLVRMVTQIANQSEVEVETSAVTTADELEAFVA